MARATVGGPTPVVTARLPAQLLRRRTPNGADGGLGRLAVRFRLWGPRCRALVCTLNKKTKRESEMENVWFQPYPHWVVSVGDTPTLAHANRLFTRHHTHVLCMLVSSFCLYIGFAVSIPLPFFCIGIPTNIILFCVGSKRIHLIWCRTATGVSINSPVFVGGRWHKMMWKPRPHLKVIDFTSCTFLAMSSYVNLMSGLCQPYVSPMSALCRAYVSIISALSQAYVSLMSELCQAYASLKSSSNHWATQQTFQNYNCLCVDLSP